MKLAVCISGHLRTFRDTAESLHENVLKQISSSYDVFIYCSPDRDRGSWRARPDLSPKELLSSDVEDAINLYRPKILKIDDKNESTDCNRTPMLRRIKLCNNLVEEYCEETGVQYDAVLRVRPDTVFTEKMSLDQSLTDDSILFLQYGRHHDGYYDGFALSTPLVMSKYADLVSHVDRLRRESGDHSVRIEHELKRYVEELDLKTSFIHTPSYIVRSWGDRYWFFDQDPVTYKFVPGKIHR